MKKLLLLLFLTCVIFLSCNKKDADIPDEYQVVVNIPDGYPVITEHPQSNVYFVHEATDPLIVNISVVLQIVPGKYQQGTH